MADSVGAKIHLDGEAEYRKAMADIAAKSKLVASEIKLMASSFTEQTTAEEKAAAKAKGLTDQINLQKQRVAELADMVKKSADQFGENSAQTQEWQTKLNNATARLNNLQNELDAVGKEADESGKKIGKNGDEADKAGKKHETFKKVLSGVGKALAAVGTAAAVAMTALVGGTVKLGTEVVKSYAEYEQLVGGVETLFGAGGQSLEEYAASVGKSVDEASKEFDSLQAAQESVLKNADNAYKTAGLSANDYIDTVTSFSAALISSLGGDTEKAAKYADQAITDMADNANKMGTDISSIQNAYQGFAKQQYTMLDNLKLGYGGTKGEMERLLKDAQAISGIKYDISSYADVVDAIHVIQTEMGITGTTAKEAEKTISGSLNATKAAWQNLITGLGNANADIQGLTKNLIASGTNVVRNIEPIIKNMAAALPTAFSAILGAVRGILPEVLGAGREIATMLLQGLTQALPEVLYAARSVLPMALSVANEIAGALVQGITQALPMLAAGAAPIAITILQSLVAALPDVISAGGTLIVSLAQGLAQATPDLVPMAINAALTVVNTLLDNIDSLVDAGIELTLGLVTGIVEATPQLVAKMPEIIVKLVDALIRNLPKIVAAAVELVMALITGITQTWAALGHAWEDLINRLKEWFNNVDWASLGKNLVQGIIDGVKRWASRLWEAVRDLANQAVSSVKRALGIKSPSKVFADEVGKMIPSGIEVGVKANMPKLDKTVGGIMADLPGIAAAGASTNTTNLGGVSINVYGEAGQDVNQLADIIMRRMELAVQRKKEVFA